MGRVVTADQQAPSPQARPDDQWTVRRIIEWTTAHLQKHGSDSPRLESEILLAHARRCRRIELYTRFDDVLTPQQRETMRELVRRRAQSEPVAYLVGHREFFSLDFHVTPDVLIPRPDTETLIVEALAVAKPLEAPSILDVGTGSGCIAVALAVNLPTARVTAIDISTAALAVARENAQRHNLGERIEFLESDLFAVLDPDRTFYLVVSNPPYIPDAEIDTLQADVGKYEPRGALAGGPDGLDIVRRLIPGAAERLVPGGWLLFEISPEQSDAAQKLLHDDGRYDEIGPAKDLTDRPRVIRARRKS